MGGAAHRARLPLADLVRNHQVQGNTLDSQVLQVLATGIAGAAEDIDAFLLAEGDKRPDTVATHVGSDGDRVGLPAIEGLFGIVPAASGDIPPLAVQNDRHTREKSLQHVQHVHQSLAAGKIPLTGMVQDRPIADVGLEGGRNRPHLAHPLEEGSEKLVQSGAVGTCSGKHRHLGIKPHAGAVPGFLGGRPEQVGIVHFLSSFGKPCAIPHPNGSSLQEESTLTWPEVR